MRQQFLYNTGRRFTSVILGVGVVANTCTNTSTNTSRESNDSCGNSSARHTFSTFSTFSFTNSNNSTNQITRLEYWDHDPKDFDVYISKPTIDDLPTLLHKFDEEGLEVWPWIWTHPNNNGPHHVFIGINERSLSQIQQLREEGCENNILIIASEGRLREVADACNDPDVYERCQCGLVVDSKVQLLNHEAKILMLDDERVIAFDCLTLV